MLFARLLLFELLLLLLFRSAPFDMLYPPPLEWAVTALKLMFLASYPALNRYYCYCCCADDDTGCFCVPCFAVVEVFNTGKGFYCCYCWNDVCSGYIGSCDNSSYCYGLSGKNTGLSRACCFLFGELGRLDRFSEILNEFCFELFRIVSSLCFSLEFFRFNSMMLYPLLVFGELKESEGDVEAFEKNWSIHWNSCSSSLSNCKIP